MDPKLLKIGGTGALVYAIATAFFYTYLAWRWPMVGRQETESVLKEVGQHPREWLVFWWAGLMVSFSLIPVFPALFQALWKTAGAYASIALFFAFIAIILGTLSPLRHAAVTPTLADLYQRATDDGARQTIALIYKAQEAYGQGLFCVFGTT